MHRDELALRCLCRFWAHFSCCLAILIDDVRHRCFAHIDRVLIWSPVELVALADGRLDDEVARDALRLRD